MKLKVKTKKLKPKIKKRRPTLVPRTFSQRGTRVRGKTKKAASKQKKIISKIFSKKALKKFKQLLIQQREKFVGEMERITNDTLKKSQRDASGDLSGYTFHMADMATDHYDREFSLGLATAEQRIIYEIDEALKTIEDGSYGICFSCDKPISKKRLKAVPYAKHCIDCQQKEELMQKKGI